MNIAYRERFCLWFGIVIISVACVLSSCHSTSTRTNSEEDALKTRDRISMFYVKLQSQNMDALLQMIGPELTPDTVRLIVDTMQDTLGYVVDATIVQVATHVELQDGIESSIDCKAEVDVEYSRGKAHEIVYLRGKNFDSAKVSGYFISLR
jgi:hypothetical protein